MKLKYPGVPVYFNGQNYYIPSLTWGVLEENYASLSAPPAESGKQMFDYVKVVIPLIGIAIRRNYPEVTDENLLEWLDLHTLPIALRALQSATGLTPVTEGE